MAKHTRQYQLFHGLNIGRKQPIMVVKSNLLPDQRVAPLDAGPRGRFGVRPDGRRGQQEERREQPCRAASVHPHSTTTT